MKILALDLGTKCGWAFHDGKKIKHGRHNFEQNTHFDGAGMIFLKFEEWLQRFREAELIAVEGVMRHGANETMQQHRYGGLLAIVQKFGEKYRIPYTGEGVTTIKKFWTGSGKANKDAMVDEAIKRGFNVKYDDEADALGLLHLILDRYAELI